MSTHATCRARMFLVLGTVGVYIRKYRYYIGRTKADAARQFFKEFSSQFKTR